MLQNAYFLAKIGADTAENEQHFAEILPKTGNYPTGPTGQEPRGGAGALLPAPRRRVRGEEGRQLALPGPPARKSACAGWRLCS